MLWFVIYCFGGYIFFCLFFVYLVLIVVIFMLLFFIFFCYIVGFGVSLFVSGRVVIFSFGFLVLFYWGFWISRVRGDIGEFLLVLRNLV